MAVRAATIAGDPKPWVTMEKLVRCLWIMGSRMGWGEVLHRGDLSWFNRSINSLQIIFEAKRRSFLLYISVGSVCCLLRYSATCLAGNSVSQT